MQLKSQRRCWAKRETCISSAWTRSPQAGTVLAGRAISVSGRQTRQSKKKERERERDLGGAEIPAWTFSKVSMGCGNNANLLWRTTVLLAANLKGWIFYDEWYKGFACRKAFQAECRTAPLRMICYCQRQQTKATLPPRVLQRAGCLVFLPGPTLRLLSQRTSALGHISCTQQSSRAACGFGTAMFILPTPTSTWWPVCGYPAHIWPKGTVASEKGYPM